MINDNGALRNQLLQLIPSGVGVYDVKGDTVRKEYLNDGYFQMIGAMRKDRHQFDGTDTINAVMPEDLAGLLAEAHASIRESRMLEYRFRLLDGQGGYSWVAIRANHVPIDAETERFYAAYYDIDELIRTQEKLRDNELQLGDLLRYSEILHFTYYPQQHRYEVMVLPEKLRNLPKSMDDFPDALIRYAALNQEDADSFREMVRRIDDGAPESECTIHFFYEGKYTWYRVRLLSFPDENGRPVRAIGNAINVDKYKEAERALHEERLHMLSLQSSILAASCFNVTKDLNVSLNNDANLRYTPSESETLFAEAIEADHTIALQAPGTLQVLLSAAEQIPDRAQRRQFFRLCGHGGMLRRYESGQREAVLEYRRRTGIGLIWVSTRIVFLPDPDTGDVLAFFYTTDVNDRVIYRKITGEILQKNYESLAYYDLNTGRLYIGADDSNAGVSFRQVDCESAFELAVELYVQEDETQEVREKFSVENILVNLKSAPSYAVYYTSNQRDETLPDAPFKRMKSDFFYLDESCDIIVLVQTNVTAIYEQERENREKMAAALQAAEDANSAKTEFLSRISHDIRTPISIISSMTDFAFADLHDEEKLKNDLNRIKTANTFLLSLISDVLDISKIDSGKIQLDPAPYTFEEHSANIRNVLEPMCEEKGLHCVFERRRKTGVIVADSTRLNQITLNLLSNAVKYTPTGGTVTYISDSENLPDAKIRFGFEIRDTGIGMSKAFQEKMFEPFAQEYDNPLRPKGTTGTGLGLAIVKKMVDLMGGTLKVESELGKGTVVRCEIVFPDALRDEHWNARLKQQPAVSVSADALHGRVLLAEDNEINREIALRIVGGFGPEVDCAENGRRAVELFAASAPGTYRAVLMDIQMPLMNGYDATCAIRALPRPDAQTVPVIAMTADAFADAMQRGFEAGMTEYLLKPLDPQKLYAVLKSAFEKSET